MLTILTNLFGKLPENPEDKEVKEPIETKETKETKETEQPTEDNDEKATDGKEIETPEPEPEKLFSLEYVKTLRDENKQRRLETQKLRDDIAKLNQGIDENKKQVERAKLDEVERLKLERDEALTAVQGMTELAEQMAKEQAIGEVAEELGFMSTADARDLISKRIAEIPLTNGEPDRLVIKDLLNDLLEAKPYLRRDAEKLMKVTTEQSRKTVQPATVEVKRPVAHPETTKEQLDTEWKDALKKRDMSKALQGILRFNDWIRKNNADLTIR